jgi:nucleoside-diphosphate-sugar epimerase
MRIFVTGATGVVGRRLLPMLVAHGHRVTALARNPQRHDEVSRAGASPLDLDLFDPAAVNRAVDGHEIVINLATAVPRGLRMFTRKGWAENDRLRSIASANLVDAAVNGGVRRFIQESFAPVYPDRGDEWIDEHTPIEPAPYNRSVADAEANLRRFSGSGRKAIVLRFAMFYGPDSDFARSLIRFVRRGLGPLPGPAEGFLSVVTHDDAATAVFAALDMPAGAYNVVDCEPMRRRAFFDALAEALGVRPPKLAPAWARPVFGSLGETLSRSLRISSYKLRNEGAWMPVHRSAREGWRAIVAESRA